MSAIKKDYYMRFEIRDLLRSGRKVSCVQNFYLNGEGRLFNDCDPNGVDMSNKRRIVGVDSNRYSVEMADTSTNSAMVSASQIIRQLRSWSAEERKAFLSEISAEYCILCGNEQTCYCAPCYDE